MKSNNNSAPQGSSLGVKKGKLAPCKTSPNCVSSQAEDKHYLSPINYKNLTQARQVILTLVKELPNSKIIEKKQDYIRAEVKSGFFKFIDDVEFYFSEKEKKIHFRSAARSGYWDLGVNKKRMKEIKDQFANCQKR